MSDNGDAPLPEIDPWSNPWPGQDLDKKQRSATGQWKPGVSGNPNGKPPAEYFDKLTTLKKVALDIFCDKLTIEKWGEICEAQIDKATKGKDSAIEWVSRYVMPPQNNGAILRPFAGGVLIEPIDNYRAGLMALAPPDDDTEEMLGAGDSDDQRE